MHFIKPQLSCLLSRRDSEGFKDSDNEGNKDIECKCYPVGGSVTIADKYNLNITAMR